MGRCGRYVSPSVPWISLYRKEFRSLTGHTDTVAKEAAEEATANGTAGAPKGARPVPSRSGARPSTTGRDDDDDEDDRRYEGEGIVGDDDEY